MCDIEHKHVKKSSRNYRYIVNDKIKAIRSIRSQGNDMTFFVQARILSFYTLLRFVQYDFIKLPH